MYVGKIYEENLISCIKALEMSQLSHLPSLENFTFQILHLYHAFSSVYVHKYIKYNPIDRLCYGPTLLCAK